MKHEGFKRISERAWDEMQQKKHREDEEYDKLLDDFNGLSEKYRAINKEVSTLKR